MLPNQKTRKHNSATLANLFNISTAVILLIGIVSASVVFKIVENEQKVHALDRFSEVSEQAIASLERTMARTEDTLISIVALFSGTDQVKRDQFQNFTSLMMSDRVGIQALKWIPRVRNKDRVSFEHAARLDGLDKFSFRQITENKMSTAQMRSEYFPVYYVEPMKGNEKAVGFDLASNPVRKAALELTRDSGSIISSDRITLVQESAKQTGVIVFAPIYEAGVIPITTEGRRRALTGFGLGVFRIGDLLDSATTGLTKNNLYVAALYDVADTNNSAPLHAAGIGQEADWPTLSKMEKGPSYTHKFKFGGREWHLVIAPKTGTLLIELSWISWLAAFITLSTITMIGFYVRMTSQRKEYAENLVRERTRDLETLAANLKTSEERTRSVVENIGNGIVIINEQGIMQTTNPAMTTIFGYPENKLVGRNFKILTPSPHQENHDNYLLNYLKTGNAQIIGTGIEVLGARTNGTEFPMELTVSELRLNGKRVFMGVISDITERKEIDRVKNEFVSSVSHELRTPLTSIRGSLGLIESGVLKDPEKIKQMVQLASNNTERLVNLVNDLLDIEKLQSGNMEFKYLPINVRDLVKTVIESTGSYARQHNVNFVLKNSASGSTVWGDWDCLAQVITNLLSNAAKFSPDGETVSVSIIKNGGSIKILVSDKGPGIAEDFQSKVFDRFTQADASATRQKGGTGLGLSISKAIIEELKGEIGFQTKIGKGTTFFINLPQYEKTNSIVNEAAIPKMRLQTPPSSDLPRILHIEDDNDLCQVVRTLINDSMEYVNAQTLKLAREYIKNHKFDLIIIDPGMPDGNGLEILGELPESLNEKASTIVFSSKVMATDDTSLSDCVLLKSKISNDEFMSVVQQMTTGKITTESTSK